MRLLVDTFVCMRRVPIEDFLRESEQALILDVRSPGEYKHAHLPGAINLPLFTDEERKVVGTSYKQVSRQEAIKIGLDYFGPKMRSMVEDVERLIVERWPLAIKGTTQDQRPTANICIYCWRGGMRSGAVAWLLNLYGFSVTVLSGGYKAFRNWVINTNAQPYRLQLIGGYTGSGKTMLLQEMERRGELTINLEELAAHKGSAFGNIGMPAQPSQEMFENLLAVKMAALNSKAEKQAIAKGPAEHLVHESTKKIWIEDESQRIGLINIPQSFWQNMRCSPIFFLDIPFEERLEHLIKEYGGLDTERMIAAIERIAKRLGPMETKTAVQFLREGNVKESFRILLHYYDKRYLKGLHNREGLSSLLTNIPCEKVSVDNASLVSQPQHASIYAGTK